MCVCMCVCACVCVHVCARARAGGGVSDEVHSRSLTESLSGFSSTRTNPEQLLRSQSHNARRDVWSWREWACRSTNAAHCPVTGTKQAPQISHLQAQRPLLNLSPARRLPVHRAQELCVKVEGTVLGSIRRK